jgi:hypothetical protein
VKHNLLRPGTKVVISEIFSQKIGGKIAIYTQNTGIYAQKCP